MVFAVFPVQRVVEKRMTQGVIKIMTIKNLFMNLIAALSAKTLVKERNFWGDTMQYKGVISDLIAIPFFSLSFNCENISMQKKAVHNDGVVQLYLSFFNERAPL